MIYWDFNPQPSQGFTENGPKEQISREQQVSGARCLVDAKGQMSEENGQTETVGDERKL